MHLQMRLGSKPDSKHKVKLKEGIHIWLLGLRGRRRGHDRILCTPWGLDLRMSVAFLFVYYLNWSSVQSLQAFTTQEVQKTVRHAQFMRWGRWCDPFCMLSWDNETNLLFSFSFLVTMKPIFLPTQNDEKEKAESNCFGYCEQYCKLGNANCAPPHHSRKFI